MNKENVLLDLQTIFRDHFTNDHIELTPSTTQADVSDWDSLNHAILIDKVEQHYAIKFDLMDMISMQNIGDICDRILVKQTS